MGKKIEKSKASDEKTSTSQLISAIDELKRANTELLEARRASLNLIEDVVLSKNALLKSEEKYRAIFNSINEGFSLLEIHFNESDKADNIILRDANPAQDRINGIKRFINKPVKEFFPEVEQLWIQRYERVLKTGIPEKFEEWSEVNQRWYQVHASRVGDQGSTFVAVVYDDITERKLTEARQAYLLKLTDVLRPLSAVGEVWSAACGLLLGHLNANECYYAEVDGNRNIIHTSVNNLQPIGGSFHYKDFRVELVKKYLTANTRVCNNTQTDPDISQAEKMKFAEAHIGAYIATPVIANGEWIASLLINSDPARKWKEWETDLIRETVERTLIAAEKAKAEEALRIKEQRIRRLKDAYKAVVNNAKLNEALAILSELVIDEERGEARTAFYIANDENTALNTIRGAGNMPEAYADEIDGFLIGLNSLACGLAVPTGRPVITDDVYKEPLWAPWVYIADKYGYRGCWSFPIITVDEKAVGTLALYFDAPRKATAQDIELAETVTQAAAAIITNHAIKEQKFAAEEALRKSEAHLAATLELVPVGIAVLNAEGYIKLSNKEMHRYMPAGVIPTKDKERVGKWKSYDRNGNVIEPDNFPPAKALKGESASAGEFLFKQDSGSEVWTLVDALPIKDDKGNVTEVVTVVTDINQIKKAAEQLKDFNTKLEQEVSQRTSELKQSQEELHERNMQLQNSVSQLESFNYVTSHDLQEPLRKIQMLSNLIAQREVGMLSEKSKTYFSLLNTAAKQMHELITDLLIYSRTSTGTKDVKIVNLNECLEEVKQQLSSLIETTHAIIKSDTLPEITGTAFQIKQVFSNLITNSIKFAKPNTVPIITIHYELVNSDTLTPQRQLSHLIYHHIAIRDNGIGFAAEFNDHVFGLFKRLHEKSEYPGTGIGLSIVKKVVENHDGFVTAEGRKDEGTIIHLYLPVKN